MLIIIAKNCYFTNCSFNSCSCCCSFFRKFGVICFLKHLFWDSPFCHITDELLFLLFQFQTDPENSVFKINSVSGMLSGNSSKTVIVNFAPVKPIVYCKKMVCLIHNQVCVRCICLELFYVKSVLRNFW